MHDCILFVPANADGIGRSAYVFEIDRRVYAKAKDEMLSDVKVQTNLMEFAE